MTMRKFYLNIVAEIDLDDKVIKRGMSKEFSDKFYDLQSPEQVASHIGYNMILNNCQLFNLDGFADLPNNLACLQDVHVDNSEEYEE